MKPCFESLPFLREFLYTKDRDHILTLKVPFISESCIEIKI